MPLVTRQVNQGNLFLEATEPAQWQNGDVWSDTTSNSLKINVDGTAQSVTSINKILTYGGNT